MIAASTWPTTPSKKYRLIEDIIVIKKAIEEARTVVALCDPEGAHYAVVEFTGEQ